MLTVGITSRFDENKNVFIKKNYYNWLYRYFNIIIITPNINRDYKKISLFCDLLMISGGDDINPMLYKEENSNSFIENILIEQMDFDLIKEFVKMKKPIIGICRGIQVINVYFEGSLIQDIDEYNTSVNHKKGNHEIIIDKNSILSKYYDNSIIVNSYHHQCIKNIAPYFYINAISEDGFIEGIEYKNIIGVQWHPELLDDTHKQNFILLMKDLILNK